MTPHSGPEFEHERGASNSPEVSPYCRQCFSAYSGDGAPEEALAFINREHHLSSPFCFVGLQLSCSSPTALIMAGGRSERMRAGGCAQHKGLRTVLGVPLVERNLQRLLELGFEDIYVSVSAREKELSKWLAERGRALAAAKRATLEIVSEDSSLGTIGAAGLLPKSDRPAMVVNVDNLSSLDLTGMVNFHRQNRAAATIATHRQLLPIAFGVLELQGDSVVAYREKPVFEIVVSSGAYVLGPAALVRLQPGAHMNAPELMNDLIQGGEKVIAYAHQEPWIDINDEEALFRAEWLLSPSAVLKPGEAPESG